MQSVSLKANLYLQLQELNEYTGTEVIVIINVGTQHCMFRLLCAFAVSTP